MYKIMMIEDDLKLSMGVSHYLEKWSYQVELVHDFHDIMPQVVASHPDLILLDINLPYYDGFYWCQEIRKVSHVPILFISSRETEMDKIMGMQLGADDYIEKPFSLELLLSKVQAILRRTYAYQDASLNILEYQSLFLDLEKAELHYHGKHILLTPNEYKILGMLLKHGGKIVKRETIIEALWDDERFIDDNTLTVNMNRLRKKLVELEGVMIETIKNEGYVLRCE